MRKQDLRILIVDDDQSQGSAIEKALKKAGYHPTFCSNVPDAEAQLKVNAFKLVILDCMLPVKNGLDLAKSLQADDPSMRVILMSGIYKDRSFIQDAERKINLSAFMAKPFDIENMIDVVDESVADLIPPERPPIYQLFSIKDRSNSNRVQAIQKNGEIQGFDLPWVYSLFAHSKLSGELTLKDEHGAESAIRFYRGEVAGVQTADDGSYFGKLLIEKGFISNEELEAYYRDQGTKKIGEQLVDASALSPHAIQVVLREQMAIRLSQLITHESYEINFKEAQEGAAPDVTIASRELRAYYHDWIYSKLSSHWITSLYMTWMDHEVYATHRLEWFDEIIFLPLFQSFGEIPKVVDGQKTLQEILDYFESDSAKAVKVIHYMLVIGMIYFSEDPSPKASLLERKSRLKKIWEEMKDKDYYDVLGIPKSASQKQILQGYHELAKVFHPDKFPQDIAPDFRELVDNVFNRITSAYETLKDETRRQEYKVALDKGHTEQILKSEENFEVGRKLLEHRRFDDAVKVFEVAAEVRGRRSDMNIYLAWAKLKSSQAKSPSDEFLKTLFEQINEVPMEDRHVPEYFFVKAMFYRLIDNREKSKSNFKRALSLDPTFLEAKRELNVLRSMPSRKDTNILDLTVGEAVTRLFKPKKSG